MYIGGIEWLGILLITKKFTDISDIPPMTYINNTVLRVIMLIKVFRTTVKNYRDGKITFIHSDN
jgi:hypothetical protein